MAGLQTLLVSFPGCSELVKRVMFDKNMLKCAERRYNTVWPHHKSSLECCDFEYSR